MEDKDGEADIFKDSKDPAEGDEEKNPDDDAKNEDKPEEVQETEKKEEGEDAN